MKQAFDIIVDIQRKTNHTNVEFSQINLNTSELNINIADGGKEFPLNDSDKIIVYFKKPDQKVVFQEKQIKILDKTKGKINVLLASETLAKAGTVYGIISIEREEDGVQKRLGTYDFSFEVRSSFSSDDAIESTNEFQMFDKLLKLEEQDISSIVASKETAEAALAKSTENTNQIGNLSKKTVWVSVNEFGDVGDGTDSSDVFDLAFAQTDKITTVHVPDGVYGVSRTLVVPPKVRLVFSQNAVLKPLADINVIQIKPEAYVEGVTIDLRTLPFTFTKTAIYFDAEDIFQFYEQTHMLKDINILGKRATSGWTGTGILMEAKTAMSYIDNVKCNNITITNMQKCIHLRVDPSIQKEEDMAWVNANFFHQITMMNFEYGLYLEGDSKVPRDVGGNLFDQVQFQAEAGTKRLIYCEGGTNRFNIFGWDIHKIKPTEAAYEFTKSARFNQITSPMSQEITEGWIDEGYLNSFPSPNNYMADKRINAMPISLPFQPNFLGNQDDYLANGHKRGYTVTKVSSHPLVAGELTDIFTFDTESGITFDGTNATYENPIVIEIDTSSDPVWYGAFLTVMSSWGSHPQNYEMEMYDDLSKKWIGVHWTKNNRSQAIAVSAPWASIDKCTKIRIKCWGSNLSNKRIGISRVMLTSTKDGGKAYLPYTDYKDTPPEIDIPPLLPNDKTMVGDQDDVLLLADKRYKVNLTGVPKTSGNIWSMFSMRREQFCRWTNPTVEQPAVIEIDFGSTPLQYLESIGIAFGWGETAKNIKIEHVTSLNGAYTQLTNVTGNTSDTIHVAARTPDTYKIRFTFSLPNNPNTLVRVNRIFATSADDYPKTFVNTESDNELYGDLKFGDAAKGIVLKSPDGSYWKAHIDDGGTLTWVKQ